MVVIDALLEMESKMHAPKCSAKAELKSKSALSIKKLGFQEHVFPGSMDVTLVLLKRGRLQPAQKWSVKSMRKISA